DFFSLQVKALRVTGGFFVSDWVSRSLQGCNHRRVYNVFWFTAARQVVCRSSQSLQNGSYGFSPRHPLHQLIGNVSGLQVWEDECVRAAGHKTSWSLHAAYSWYQCCVRL